MDTHVDYRCPECGELITAPAGLEGRAAECPECGERVSKWPAPKADKPRSRSNPSGGLYLAVLLFSIVAGLCVWGALQSPAPQGAIWAALACCAGIFARIMQAEAHHHLRQPNTTPPPITAHRP